MRIGVPGLEFYSGFLELKDRAVWSESRRIAADHGMTIPMLCCSPDFTHADATFRQRQIEQQIGWIEMCAELGGSYCRVLSGQRRPEVSRDDGLRYAAESIMACTPAAAELGVTLIIENHYKDNYWEYPEFAQSMTDFCDLVAMIDSPHFGVNYDPSNALLAGDVMPDMSPADSVDSDSPPASSRMCCSLRSPRFVCESRKRSLPGSRYSAMSRLVVSQDDRSVSSDETRFSRRSRFVW